MTENSRKVLDYLKSKGVGTAFTVNEVKDALGFESGAAVTGAVSGLVRKDRAERFIETVEIDGKMKEVKKFALTQAGMDFNPDEEDS